MRHTWKQENGPLKNGRPDLKTKYNFQKWKIKIKCSWTKLKENYLTGDGAEKNAECSKEGEQITEERVRYRDDTKQVQ